MAKAESKTLLIPARPKRNFCWLSLSELKREIQRMEREIHFCLLCLNRLRRKLALHEELT